MNRRDFLRTGLGAGAAALTPVLQPSRRARVVSLVVDPADAVASAPPATWALGVLDQALSAAGHRVRRLARASDAGAGDICVLASGRTPAASTALSRARVTMASAPESLAIVPLHVSGRDTLIACGADTRGLVYALLEIAERVRAREWPAPGTPDRPVAEEPANPVRSVMRQFTSEALDKPWFYDREGWRQYLSMLAAHRFNRLHLAFGLGYDTLQDVADSYLLFLYPFLLAVPGYDVRVSNLSDAERDRNLEALKFISDETVARGLDCELGVWMHGYQLGARSRARYIVEGLTPDRHPSYCRDALTAVLRACPAVSSVGLRIHGESGIAEGSYDFWTTVFDGVTRAGRTIEIDLHAKGIDQTMIARALGTGQPVNLSPKYWAEHLGMPYHQAAIRDLEMPVAGRTGAGLMTLSEGARVFTRYGYADLLRDDRQYTVRHRVFSGTQRLLASADPVAGAAYSSMFQFCGSTGVDVMEPLTCRGRRGSGGTSTRIGYVETRLEPRWDWQKYSAWYRAWGRTTYNANTAPDIFHREFGRGSRARALDAALASASRILPIVTTAYLPSAACDAYWPEVYWNQPIVPVDAEDAGGPGTRPDPYSDTPAPKTFQHASPLDPQIFSRMSDCAGELLAGRRSGKYSPVEVAAWLDARASEAASHLARAGVTGSVGWRRTAIDVAMVSDLGRFFAAKFRSGVLYAVYEQTGDRRALEEALRLYRVGRVAWAALTQRASGVYADDLSVSDRPTERGAWGDRLTAIDQDIARMARLLPSAKASDDPRAGAAVAAALAPPPRPVVACTHTPPAGFHPGANVPVDITLVTPHPSVTARLYYRHVNQAERFAAMEMTPAGARYRGEIPAAYTDSPYPLQYYVEFTRKADRIGEADAVGTDGPSDAWLFPGFTKDFTGLPYFVLRRV